MWPVPYLLNGHVPERSPRSIEEEGTEVEVYWLSGRNNLLQVSSDTTPRKLRETLRRLRSNPFLTVYGLGGELLEFEKPLTHQLELLHDKYHAQAIAQHPSLTCNEQAAILWCANNPFLCAMGAGGYGNCLDSTGSPYAVPIKQVFGGKFWFLAVRAGQSIIARGELPDCLQRITYPRGNLGSTLYYRRCCSCFGQPACGNMGWT